MANHSDFTYLSPLDKIMPRAYVGQILCFPSTDPHVYQVLKDGLASVVADIPYLFLGVVTSEDHKFISLSEPYQNVDDLFSCYDLSESIVYESIKAAHFPPSAFNLDGIKLPDTLPPYTNPAPVFRARLSLVSGGFILFVAVYYSTTDITGYGSLLRIWASYCWTGSSAAAGFDPSWMDRKARLRPSEAETTPVSIPGLLYIREPTELSRLSGSLAHIGEFKTAIFFFPQKGLQRLKDAVNEHISPQAAGTWVSTSDILTALLWSSLLAAEQQISGRTADSTKTTNTISFPVNFRSRFSPSLPNNYLGAAFIMTCATAPREDLLSLSLVSETPCALDGAPLAPAEVSVIARLAAAIRNALHRVDESSVRSVLAYLDAQAADHPPVILGPRDDGISVVSWADEGVYELDWGEVVGRCEAVRLPRLAYKRNPIVLPRVPAGVDGNEAGLEVIISFNKEILESIAQNRLLRRFATLRYCS